MFIFGNESLNSKYNSSEKILSLIKFGYFKEIILINAHYIKMQLSIVCIIQFTANSLEEPM
jgi:hypothetical protein